MYGEIKQWRKKISDKFKNVVANEGGKKGQQCGILIVLDQFECWYFFFKIFLKG
jgi:hypothetical protein